MATSLIFRVCSGLPMAICRDPVLPPTPDLWDPKTWGFAVFALLQIYLSSTYWSRYFCGSDPSHVTLHLPLTCEVWGCKTPRLALARSPQRLQQADVTEKLGLPELLLSLQSKPENASTCCLQSSVQNTAKHTQNTADTPEYCSPESQGLHNPPN